MYTERLKYAISGLPGPLEFFGYVYCFTTFLAGPGALCYVVLCACRVGFVGLYYKYF